MAEGRPTGLGRGRELRYYGEINYLVAKYEKD